MKKTVSIITLLLLTLSLLVGCAPGAAPSTSVPTETTAPTEPTPAETTPTTEPTPVETTPTTTTEPESTTQPAEIQEFLPIRPIPDVYNIYTRWPDWDMSKLLSDEMKDYTPWVYPFWQNPTSRSDWIMVISQSVGVDLIGNGKEAYMTDERLGKLAWLEVEWEYLNQKPIEKSWFTYLELDREDYLNVLPAGGVEIDSPYVIPEEYDVRIQDPDWFERPHYWNDASTAQVYPYWEGKEYRIAWINSTLYQYRLPASLYGIEAFKEGELEKIAWLEAQLQYLGGQLHDSVVSTLGINREDYLTAK